MRWDDYLKILQNISLRYFYIAGIAFALGYVLLRKWIAKRKIQQKFPGMTDYLREILLFRYNDADVRFCSFLPYQESKH